MVMIRETLPFGDEGKCTTEHKHVRSLSVKGQRNMVDATQRYQENEMRMMTSAQLVGRNEMQITL
jgi:hypothetical protein